MRICKKHWLGTLVLAALFTWSAAEAGPWPLEQLRQAPAWTPAPEFQEEGVRALFFDGLPWHGKPTRVFAWYGTPDLKPGEHCPAMVLVHGGGGTAFAEWVRLWNRRGYAAIAMDTCGSVPKGEYGKWERHTQGGPPGWGGFETVQEPVQEQWPYHAVADVVLAHSLLRSFPEVEARRTGITGISWGGYLTCISAGIDRRFRFAAPVYGCGFLGDNSAWLDVFQRMGVEKAQRWLALWDPSVYLPKAGMPMLWVTGTNDFAYPMDSLQKSYRLPGGPSTLCIRVRMEHAHGGAGENPEEIHAFANHILKNGPPLPRVLRQGRHGREVWMKFRVIEPGITAELIYTRAEGPWKERFWESAPATVDCDRGMVRATLPPDAHVYYLNLITPGGLVISSEHMDLTEQRIDE